MRKERVKIKFLVSVALLFLAFGICGGTTINLPEPRLKGEISLEEVLAKRRSVREFTSGPLTLKEVSQLLWSAQGITEPRSGKRTAPSAGARYPIKVYLVVGNVENVKPGVYRYEPQKHQIVEVKEGDMRELLSVASLGQPWIKNGAIDLVIVGIYEITTKKYGERGIRYVYMEAGHVAQNILLQAEALNLGAVPVGAFYDNEVKKILNLNENEQPLYIIPVGRKK